MLEKKFFFGVSFIAALLILAYCLIFNVSHTATNIAMLAVFSVIGPYFGDKYFGQMFKNKLNQSRSLHLVAGILYPKIWSAIILHLSGFPLKSLFGNLVLFTVLLVVGFGLIIYLFQLRKEKQANEGMS